MTVLAITGTPGCGKTTLSNLLAARGRNVTTVEAIARQHDAVAGFDNDDDADIVDLDALAHLVLPEGTVVDGHLSHHLDVDEIWVIRCNPDVLRERMTERGYHAEKIQENWEAECMDLILQEAVETGLRVVQRDGTRRSPEELLSAFENSEPGHDIEIVDWTDHL